jgi:hypothetical protein
VKLESILPSDLDKSPVKEISCGAIYYAYTGRNAWHSTWITRYTNGCMHTTIESAKKYAERLRTRGTVFYIRQLPCLVIKSDDNQIIITEINSTNPLAGYSENAISNHLPVGHKKIDGARDNYLTIGSPINGLAMSFLPNSRFWVKRPSPRNSVIILSGKEIVTTIENIDPTKQQAYQSFSNGGNYLLGWRSIEVNVQGEAILNLSNHV